MEVTSPQKIRAPFSGSLPQKNTKPPGMSDACGNSFGRYIMIVQCMGIVFTFY